MSTTRISGRRSAILPTLIIAAVLVVAFAIFTSFWTDRLWYQSIDFGTVFTTMLLTRIGLFVAFGLLMAALVGGNAAIAYRLRSKTRLRSAHQPAARALPRAAGRPRWSGWCSAVAVLVGLFAGGAAAGQVDTFLAWRNGTPFDVTDPKFGLDIGFFVFDYPWWRFVSSFLFTALVFATIIAAVVHYITGGLRFSGPRRGGSGAAQAQLSILVGLAVLIKGVSYWFDQYGLEIASTTSAGTLHRHQLHRRQRHREREADPGGDRRHLRAAVLRQRRAAPLGDPGHRPDPADPVLDRARHRLPGRGAVLQRPARRAGQGAGLHRAQHRRHPGGVRGRHGRDHRLLRQDHRQRRPAAVPTRRRCRASG